MNYCRPPGWRPWHRGASCVYVGTQPFYFHAGFGIHFGGLALEFALGPYPPAGFAYYDPYCGVAFWSLDGYYEHVEWCGHPAMLTLADARVVGLTFAVGVHGPGFSLRVGF